VKLLGRLWARPQGEPSLADSSQVHDAADRRVVYAAAARLLQYPDEALDVDVELLARTAAGLPPRVREPLARAIDWSRREPLLDRQRAYVSTFDLKRRCCLYLTYYLNGDTRRRGMALLRFKQTYATQGLVAESGELPDFLPMVLESAVTGSEDVALALLDEYREGIEVLAKALTDLSSPWADVVDAVLATLPDLTPERREAARALVVAGPPTEQVGLEPFTTLPASIGVRA
jgi:nitrate reductase molybdenum cofactor assembly chaperone NarJ/NarW